MRSASSRRVRSDLGKNSTFQHATSSVGGLAGGRNDLRVESSEEVHDAVRSFYSSLRAALPDATIWAVNPFWDDDAPPPAIEELSAVVRESVESVGGVYVDVGQPLRSAPELVASDSVHPSDRGHEAISTAIAAELAIAR